MKKYVPSAKINNAKKDEAISELNRVLYKLEKGKIDPALDSDSVETVAKRIRCLSGSLEETVGTGDENIELVYNDTMENIKNLKKQSEQSLTGHFEEAAEDLECTITLWKDILDGVTTADSPDDIQKKKTGWTRKRLNARLDELAGIKDELVSASKRLDNEISGLERDAAELDQKVLAEDNQRKINELFRQVKAVKSKTDTLTVRNNNYSACFNLLDMIYSNAREILAASEFANEEIGKAKALLNMEKLRKVVVEPDKAISILKRMDSEMKALSDKTSAMDNKIYGLDSGATIVSEDALNYKEELMRKQREKENSVLDSEIINNNTTNDMEEKKNGIV